MYCSVGWHAHPHDDAVGYLPALTFLVIQVWSYKA